MKLGLVIISLLTGVIGIAAQSGRVKPAETPTPTAKPTSRYIPTQPIAKSPSPSPAPTVGTPGDDEVVRVESALVPIPASVVDASGRAITYLKLADFELRVDGRTVEISDLARSEVPVRLAMLFDNSSSVLIAREFEKNAAVKFFQRVIRPEKDLAALFSVSTVTRLQQRFTKDIPLLTQAIEAFPPPAGATALLDGIIDAADYLRDADGRRVIVIVSDGDDTVSDSTLEQTLKALQLANCQVYVVKTTDLENYKRTGVRRGNANLRQLAAERRMIDITAQTGGAVYSPIDERELDEAFRQISADLAQQYILSYYPEPDTEQPGEFRQISLAVKSKPNVTVRTRKGYYIPKR